MCSGCPGYKYGNAWAVLDSTGYPLNHLLNPHIRDRFWKIRGGQFWDCMVEVG